MLLLVYIHTAQAWKIYLATVGNRTYDLWNTSLGYCYCLILDNCYCPLNVGIIYFSPNEPIYFIASNITKSALVCHYTRTTIGCPSGLVIIVNSAFWGRRKKATCGYVSVQACGVNEIPMITKKLKKKCDYYGSCRLHASEFEPYLNHPCPSVRKYLEVNYTCAKGNFPPLLVARLCIFIFH